MQDKLFNPASVAVFLIPITSLSAQATTGSDIYFDPIFINTTAPKKMDLSRFDKGSAALPGTWPTDIFVNDQFISHSQVLFIAQKDKAAQPCLTREVLMTIPFNHERLPDEFSEALASDEHCLSLDQQLPDVGISYDSGSQRLDISIPQALLDYQARGYVNPALWDSGINALMLGYNVSSYNLRSHGQDSRSTWAGINAGLNLGAWYFRHDGNYDWHQDMGGQYQSLNNYVQRDIPTLKSRLRIGETTTTGYLFDTLPFRGVELAHEDRMLPSSRRGYAPDIRGTARTNARVSVKQNGNVIYETTVSPGPFVINDLYPAGYGGDLDVEVTEADGSTQQFSVPYSAITQLLRPDTHRYDLVAGRLNESTLSDNPDFYQATYQRGIINGWTVYSGLQSSGSHYNALLIGSAFSTPIGAVSIDATQSRAVLEDTRRGQSYRLSFSKYIQDTDSNLSIAAYRFSTSGFYDYRTAMRARSDEMRGEKSANIWRPKHRFNITMNQGLPEGWGQINLTGYSQNYWDRSNSDLQYQFGYSNSLGKTSFSLNAGRVRNSRGDMENNAMLNFTMPLGNPQTRFAPILNAAVTRSGNGQIGEQVGLSGSGGDDYQYNYGLNATHYNHNIGSSMTFNGGWRTPVTTLNASYGAGKHYQSQSLGASGSVIAWQSGAVMTPYTGETFAVVEAKGAKGAKVGGYPGIRIDRWGHAAVPYLNPYEINEISIDPRGLSRNIELVNTTEKVAPLSGAVSKVVFGTKTGAPLLISLSQDDGSPIPFGADIYDDKAQMVGNVGQGGQAYVRATSSDGELIVKWGEQPDQHCKLKYHGADMSQDTPQSITTTCIKGRTE